MFPRWVSKDYETGSSNGAVQCCLRYIPSCSALAKAVERRSKATCSSFIFISREREREREREIDIVYIHTNMHTTILSACTETLLRAQKPFLLCKKGPSFVYRNPPGRGGASGCLVIAFTCALRDDFWYVYIISLMKPTVHMVVNQAAVGAIYVVNLATRVVGMQRSVRNDGHVAHTFLSPWVGHNGVPLRLRKRQR